MKKVFYPLFFLILATSCSESTSSVTTNEVDSIEISYLKNEKESNTSKFHYDAQDRVTALEMNYKDGKKSVQKFTYTGQNANYNVDFDEMIFHGKYQIDSNNKVTCATDTFIMGDICISGGNLFEYQKDKLSLVKSYVNADKDMPRRDTLRLAVEWNADNMTGLSCDWTKHVNIDEQLKYTVNKTYSPTILNNANLDLNFYIERLIQNGACLSYDPLIFTDCGQRSKYMMSAYSHDIEYQNHKEREEHLEYTFKYATDDQNRIKEVKIINPAGETHITMNFSYKDRH